MSATFRFGGIAVLLSCLTLSSVRAEILVSNWRLQTTTAAGSPSTPTESVVENVVTFPFNLERRITDGRSTNITAYDFTYDPAVNDNLAIFNVAFDHTPAAERGDACLTNGRIYFSVSEELPYSFSGTYRFNAGVEYFVFADTYFKDLTTGEVLLYSTWDMMGGADMTLTLNAGVVEGAASGTLLPGHSYYAYYSYLIMGYENGSPDPSYTGSFEFVIPEPASLMLLSLGGLLLLKRRPRR